MRKNYWYWRNLIRSQWRRLTGRGRFDAYLDYKADLMYRGLIEHGAPTAREPKDEK